jgi:hypothetical protein
MFHQVEGLSGCEAKRRTGFHLIDPLTGLNKRNRRGWPRRVIEVDCDEAAGQRRFDRVAPRTKELRGSFNVNLTLFAAVLSGAVLVTTAVLQPGILGTLGIFIPAGILFLAGIVLALVQARNKTAE